MIKVSVIVPVYNTEQYLEKCLLSLLNQTLPSEEIEIIAINNASVDNSFSILEALSKKYDNLIILNCNKKGVSATRNKGLKIANGEYIGFVDSDDYVELNTYEVLYNKAKEVDADVVFTTMFKNNDEKYPIQLKNGLYEKDNIIKEIYPILISSLNASKATLRGSVCCKVFKRELIKDNKIIFPENLVYNEDGYFSILATIQAKRFLSLGELYFYHNRVNDTSATKKYVENLWDIQKELIHLLEENVKVKEYDFNLQIAKKALDVAIYSIENEAKTKNINSKKQKKKIILEIFNDSILLDKIKNIDKKSLKKIDKWYLYAIKLKMPSVALKIAKYRYRNNPYF